VKFQWFSALALFFSLATFSTITSAADAIKIVTLGDSITHGTRTGVPADTIFAARIEKSLNGQGISCEVVNVGIGGERTDQALKRLERDVLSLNPQFVVVMYGTNDSFVDVGKKQSRISPDAYEKNLRELVTRLRDANSQPILMTEPRWGDDAAGNGLGEHPNVRLEQFVERCRLVAKEMKVPLVDNFAAWTTAHHDGQDLSDWTTDECHPNSQGHKVIADRLHDVLANQLGGLDYDLELTTINSGYDGKTCWVHPRLGTIPGDKPIVVLTMQKLLLTGSDVFYALHEMRTDDMGKSWSGPTMHDNLGRRPGPGDMVSVICDFTPMWHAKSGKLLGTGHIASYKGDHLAKSYSRKTSYSVYDQEAKAWSTWETVDMPDNPRFFSSGAGCTQRFDLPNGDILLPFYTKAKGEKRYTTSVMRCRFDGKIMTYLEHGPELALEVVRGMVEPSITQFKGKFYLTIRNDEAGYITTSIDGLNYDKPIQWTFDDGEELGSYNTQQHWVTHSDGLFLVYTRRGADNDHVFRHRAPLFIAQVDPDSLQVIRNTERVLAPERGARLGNFSVANVNENETWVSVAEWMQRKGPDYVIPVDNELGADNSIFVTKIKWKQPNRSLSMTK